jgi:hypothetical protein
MSKTLETTQVLIKKEDQQVNFGIFTQNNIMKQ